MAVCCPAGKGRQAPVPLGHDAGHMFAVAAETVRTHTGQDHFHAGISSRFAHEQGVYGGRVTDGLVEDFDQPR